jgi:catechol-2,3-dioxygenase
MAVISPKFHHVNLKTTRLDEMVDWYSKVVGAEVIFKYDMGAWLSNDAANHRIALLAFPNFTDDPEKDDHAGMHHTAFEYDSFDDLNASYLRLRDAGIAPAICLDHGMTFSYYYADPDGNNVELQCDVFGDWEKSTEWMRTSIDFKNDPLGKFVDPEKVAADRADGLDFEAIHEKAMASGYAPETAPIELPEAS